MVGKWLLISRGLPLSITDSSSSCFLGKQFIQISPKHHLLQTSFQVRLNSLHSETFAPFDSNYSLLLDFFSQVTNLFLTIVKQIARVVIFHKLWPKQHLLQCPMSLKLKEDQEEKCTHRVIKEEYKQAARIIENRSGKNLFGQGILPGSLEECTMKPAKHSR